MTRDRNACQICFRQRGRSHVGSYCLACYLVCQRIAEHTSDAWPARLPPDEQVARQERLARIAERVAREEGVT